MSKTTFNVSVQDLESLRRTVSFALSNCSEVRELFFGQPPEPSEKEFERLHTLLVDAISAARVQKVEFEVT